MFRLPFAPLAAAIVAVGEAAYLVCVAVGALWPDVFWMRTSFPALFPGFTWLDPLSFLLGLVEVALYGLAAAAVAALAWNYVVGRAGKTGT
ncbi:MAG: DUF5676 family membrane protein [Candidatus Limnocylindrales bacterium]